MIEVEGVVLLLTAFYATFSFVIVLPGLPEYIDDTGLFYGFTTAAFPAATAILAVVIVRAQKHYSSRHLLLVCFSLGTLCSIAYGLCRNRWAILILRAITGASTCCVVIVRDDLNKLCGRDNKKRIRYMSMFTFAMGTGYSLGAIVGAALEDVSPSISVNEPFAVDGNSYCGFALAVVDVMLILLTGFFMPSVSPAVTITLGVTSGVPVQVDGTTSHFLLDHTTTGRSVQQSGAQPQDQGAGIASSEHLMVYLSTFLVTISFVGFLTLAVPHIASLEHLSNSTAGFIEAAVGGAYGIAAICNPFLIDHMPSSAATMALAGAAAALANGLMIGNPMLAQVIIACFLIGMSYSIINSVGMYHLGALSKQNRYDQTRSFAVVTSLMSVGRVIAPIIVGVTEQYNVEQVVYIVSLVLGAVSGLFCAGVWWLSKLSGGSESEEEGPDSESQSQNAAEPTPPFQQSAVPYRQLE